MKDLGFGILDRRTVIVALLTIVIVNVFFQFGLPIRIGNAGEIFIDLVLFTGYLYLAHSLLRLFVMIFLLLIAILSMRIHDFAWSRNINEMDYEKNVSKLKIAIYKTTSVLIYSIKSIFFTIVTVPFLVFSSTDYEAEIANIEISNEIMKRPTFFRFFERASLIAIVIFATMPNYTIIAKQVGAIGLIVMMLIYLFKGDFSFFVKDQIAEESKEESKTEKTSPHKKPRS